MFSHVRNMYFGRTHSRAHITYYIMWCVGVFCSIVSTSICAYYAWMGAVGRVWIANKLPAYFLWAIGVLRRISRRIRHDCIVVSPLFRCLRRMHMLPYGLVVYVVCRHAWLCCMYAYVHISLGGWGFGVFRFGDDGDRYLNKTCEIKSNKSQILTQRWWNLYVV